MWFWFSLIALICWSGSDLFSKIGCQDADDKYSHLKMVMAVGLVMGLHAAYEIFINGTEINGSIILTYLPVSLLYISSMTIGYIGLRYIELSISSPICNSSGALVAVLALVSVVVISNTIRLTVFARRKEINIMKYVGATNGFIRWPFFVEGTSVGLISGLLAAGLVIGAYALVVNRIGAMSGFWGPILGSCMLSVGQVWPVVLGAFLIFGVVIGSIGTATSIRKYLEV
jgi:uncharacterized membrane protein